MVSCWYCMGCFRRKRKCFTKSRFLFFLLTGSCLPGDIHCVKVIFSRPFVFMLHHYPESTRRLYLYTGWLAVFKNAEENLHFEHFVFNCTHLPCIRLYLSCGDCRRGKKKCYFGRLKVPISLFYYYFQINFFSLWLSWKCLKGKKTVLAIVLPNKLINSRESNTTIESLQSNIFCMFQLLVDAALQCDQEMFWHPSSSFPCLNILTRVLSWFYF